MQVSSDFFHLLSWINHYRLFVIPPPCDISTIYHTDRVHYMMHRLQSRHTQSYNPHLDKYNAFKITKISNASIVRGYASIVRFLPSLKLNQWLSAFCEPVSTTQTVFIKWCIDCRVDTHKAIIHTWINIVLSKEKKKNVVQRHANIVIFVSSVV